MIDNMFDVEVTRSVHTTLIIMKFRKITLGSTLHTKNTSPNQTNITKLKAKNKHQQQKAQNTK